MSITQLLPNVYQQFFGITGSFSGLPLAGGFLYSYQAGTSTPQATYTDETGVTANTNPIVLNSVGAANVWLSSSAYKFVLEDANNNIQWTVDNVSYINPGSIDKTKVASNLAGIALNQNGGGSFDVQVDNTTVQVNGSNQLSVKSGNLTPSIFTQASLLEVIFRKTRDLTDPGTIQTYPQYEWTTPILQTDFGTTPTGGANVVKWSPNGEFLAVGSSSSPYIDIYQYNYASGFTKLADPSTLPTGSVHDLSWSPSGDFLACAHATTPAITIYQRQGNLFTKLSDPSSIPSATSSLTGTNIAFSPNGDFLAITYSGLNIGGHPAPGIIIYERGGAFTSPVTGTSSTVISLDYQGSGSDNFIYNANMGTPSNVAFPGTTANTGIVVQGGTTFTDITANTGALYTDYFNYGVQGAIAWSPDSSLFALINETSGLIAVYSRADYVFTGITAPVLTSYANDILSFSFSPDGNFFIVTLSITPYVLIFQIQSDIFSQCTNQITIGGAGNIAWAPNSEYIAIPYGVSPYIYVYKIANPTTTPTFTIQSAVGTPPNSVPTGINWSITKEFMAVTGSSSPYVQIYETSSVLSANSLLWTRGIPNV